MILENAKYVPTRNISGRKGEQPVAVIIHYTAAGSAMGSVKWLRMPEAKASAHFVISRKGTIYQLAHLDMATWHAGRSEMVIDGESRSDANKFTIGIELANYGLLPLNEIGVPCVKVGGRLLPYPDDSLPPIKARLEYDNGESVEGFWEPYPEKQLSALRGVLQRLHDHGLGDAVERLAGHEEIAMPFGRKRDPGPLFPWDRIGRPKSRRTRSVLL